MRWPDSPDPHFVSERFDRIVAIVPAAGEGMRARRLISLGTGILVCDEEHTIGDPLLDDSFKLFPPRKTLQQIESMQSVSQNDHNHRRHSRMHLSGPTDHL